MTVDKSKHPKPASGSDSPTKEAAATSPVTASGEGSNRTPRNSQSTTDLSRVLDVTVELTVQLGCRKMRVAEVLALGPGSTVEFSKPADEALDVFVNDQLVARGEAIVLGERYGVRITEVVSANERLRHGSATQEVSA